MAFFDYAFAVIPLLGLLIFVHELGHFIAAKLCGVRVLKFSLGFGAPVGFGRYRMRWVRGGTEYVVAWFPLGGFVRMLGGNLPGDEDATDEAVDAAPDEYFDVKPVWQKLTISFAGPAMNLFLPVVCFMLIFWMGTPRPAPIVGLVEQGSPAARAGVMPGDQIDAVDGVPVVWWDEVETAIRAEHTGGVSLSIERDGASREIRLPTQARTALNGFGEVESVGWAGLGHRRLPSVVAVPGPSTPAAVSGLSSGDRITAVDGVAVESWVELESAYAEAASAAATTTSQVDLSVERPGSDTPQTLKVPALDSAASLGIAPATIIVDAVDAEMPAGRAGLQEGDLIVEVDGSPAGSFSAFQRMVFSGEGRPMEVTYVRGTDVASVTLEPEESVIPGVLGIEGMDETVYRIGIRHRPSTLPGAVELDQVRNPLVAFPRALSDTGDMIVVFMQGLGRLFTGEIGADKLSGPIGIAEVARKSLDLGWHFYIRTLMFISINLGILNLLPIPILDGGQIVLWSIEGIKRAPVSMRTREIVQSVGLTVLVMLMGLAFWNDLSRHWTRFVEWIGAGGL